MLTRRTLLVGSLIAGLEVVTSLEQRTVGETVLPVPPAGVKPKTFAFESLMSDHKGRTIKTAGKAQYFSEDLGGGVTLDLVAVPGGEFVMGSPPAERGRYREESPQHRVKIQPLWIGKFEVTHAQWRAVAALPKIDQNLENRTEYGEANDFPAYLISWSDAIEFCKRLSAKTGHNYRLPSEAQ